MYMAKRRVSMIKNDIYSPGMGHMHEQGEDFENINVQEMRDQLGEFNYDDFQFEKSLGNREQRDMVILENGARYEGEWLQGLSVR